MRADIQLKFRNEKKIRVILCACNVAQTFNPLTYFESVRGERLISQTDGIICYHDDTEDC